MKKTIIASSLALLSLNVFADTSKPDVKGNIKVLANVAAGCDLSAENINFGALQSPLTAQSATANITLTCSKGAALNLAILHAFTPTSSTLYAEYRYKSEYEYLGQMRYSATYYIYNANNKEVGAFSCDYNLTTGVIGTTFDPFSGYPSNNPTFGNWVGPDYTTTCVTSDGSKEALKPIWWVGSQKDAGKQVLDGGREIGVMTGVTKSEQIFYNLSHPTKTNEVWNSNNTYSFVGSGDEEIIPMKATISTVDSPKHRMSPDTYLDTLTVRLTY